VLVALLAVTIAASVGADYGAARDAARREYAARRTLAVAGLSSCSWVLASSLSKSPSCSATSSFLASPVYATSIVLACAPGCFGRRQPAVSAAWAARRPRAAGRGRVSPRLSGAAQSFAGAALGLAFALRLGVAVLSWRRSVLFLGMPFAWGLRTAERQIPGFALGVGSQRLCSVVGAVLAAMVACHGVFAVLFGGRRWAYALAWACSRLATT